MNNNWPQKSIDHASNMFKIHDAEET